MSNSNFLSISELDDVLYRMNTLYKDSLSVYTERYNWNSGIKNRLGEIIRREYLFDIDKLCKVLYVFSEYIGGTKCYMLMNASNNSNGNPSYDVNIFLFDMLYQIVDVFVDYCEEKQYNSYDIEYIVEFFDNNMRILPYMFDIRDKLYYINEDKIYKVLVSEILSSTSIIEKTSEDISNIGVTNKNNLEIFKKQSNENGCIKYVLGNYLLQTTYKHFKDTHNRKYSYENDKGEPIDRFYFKSLNDVKEYISGNNNYNNEKKYEFTLLDKHYLTKPVYDVNNNKINEGFISEIKYKKSISLDSFIIKSDYIYNCTFNNNTSESYNKEFTDETICTNKDEILSDLDNVEKSKLFVGCDICDDVKIDNEDDSSDENG